MKENIKFNKEKLSNIVNESVSKVINEISINAKKRNVKNAIDTYKRGRSGYNGIKTFGILSAENPDSIPTDAKTNKKNMKFLSQSLKSAHYVFVKQRGHFGGNDEMSYFIFNISLETLKSYAGNYEQTSFFYCELINVNNESKVKSSYYQKQDTTLPYNIRTNPYVLIESTTDWLDASEEEDYSIIGNTFKYTIPLKYFSSFNESVLKRIKDYNIAESTINESIHQIGIHPWYLRSALYNGIKI